MPRFCRCRGQVCGGGVRGTAFVTMEGNAVFKFAVRVLGEAVEEMLAATGLDKQRDRLADPTPGQSPHHRGHRAGSSGCRWKKSSSPWTAMPIHRRHRSRWRWTRRCATVASARGQHVLLEAVGGGSPGARCW